VYRPLILWFSDKIVTFDPVHRMATRAGKKKKKKKKRKKKEHSTT
jgi:hypothetical protein